MLKTVTQHGILMLLGASSKTYCRTKIILDFTDLLRYVYKYSLVMISIKWSETAQKNALASAKVIVTQLLRCHMPLLYFVCNHLIYQIKTLTKRLTLSDPTHLLLDVISMCYTQGHLRLYLQKSLHVLRFIW